MKPFIVGLLAATILSGFAATARAGDLYGHATAFWQGRAQTAANAIVQLYGPNCVSYCNLITTTRANGNGDFVIYRIPAGVHYQVNAASCGNFGLALIFFGATQFNMGFGNVRENVSEYAQGTC